MATVEILRQRRLDVPQANWSAFELLVVTALYFLSVLTIFAPLLLASWNILLVPAIRVRAISYLDALKLLVALMGFAFLCAWSY